MREYWDARDDCERIGGLVWRSRSRSFYISVDTEAVYAWWDKPTGPGYAGRIKFLSFVWQNFKSQGRGMRANSVLFPCLFLPR